ncbi:ribosomal protein S7 domain-containing protein [Poronia punctata]|nr:ribosomal protein S7 domain-containing protein [Poronia punctata]
MASILNPLTSLRSLAIRTRPAIIRNQITTTTTTTTRIRNNKTAAQVVISRSYSSDTTQHQQQPSEDSEEISSSSSPPPSSRVELWADNYLNAQALQALKEAAAIRIEEELIEGGLRYHLPKAPTKHEQLRDRHHPVIHQVTRILMRDGKLSQAQRNVSFILNYLRTTPPPKYSPLRPLIPGAPPAAHLPLDPVRYLTVAIDSVAPLIRVRNLKGLAGGGRALEVPEPLPARARRRQALLWIMDIVNRKKANGSGRKQFATRFGQEIVAIVEGRSSVWDRRQIVHKVGTAARANLTHHALRSKQFRK